MSYVIVKRDGWHEVWTGWRFGGQDDTGMHTPVYERRVALFKEETEAVSYVRGRNQ